VRQFRLGSAELVVDLILYCLLEELDKAKQEYEEKWNNKTGENGSRTQNKNGKRTKNNKKYKQLRRLKVFLAGFQWFQVGGWKCGSSHF